MVQQCSSRLHFPNACNCAIRLSMSSALSSTWSPFGTEMPVSAACKPVSIKIGTLGVVRISVHQCKIYRPTYGQLILQPSCKPLRLDSDRLCAA